MQFPITIGLHRSRFLDGAIALAALLVCVALLNFPAPPAVQAGLTIGASLMAFSSWKQLTPVYSTIRLEASGQISGCKARSDSFETLSLLPAATVNPWLTVIRLKDERGQVTTVIAAVDSLKTEDFRRLRVFLRWQAGVSGPDADA